MASNGTVDPDVAARAVAAMTYRDPRQYGGQRSVQPDVFSEIGTSGLRQYGGFVLEEWLAALSGRRAAWAYREMIDNSAVIGGILFAIEQLARGVEWSVEGSQERMPNGMLATEFAESNMHDLSHTWGDAISEILSFLPYGWSLHEEVFKRRQGQQPDRAPIVATVPSETKEDDSPASSEYTDGLIGWRKLAGRAQETLMRWDFAGYSTVRAMEQIDWHGGSHTIPISKAMLFRTKAARNNPEGRSILRSAYESYFYTRNIQSIEAIGIERDLAGLPVTAPPEGVDLWTDGNKDMLAKAQEMVDSIRKDENMGIVKPQAGWVLELLRTGGSRQIDTNEVLKRYRQEMASSVLADFMLVGLDGLGSYAMVDIKTDLFGMAIDAVLDSVCDVFNRYGFPRLFALNGIVLKERVRLKHSTAGRIDLEKVGNFLQHLSLANIEIPLGKAALAQLFGQAGLPVEFDGESVVTEDVNDQPNVRAPNKPAVTAKPAPKEPAEPKKVVAKSDPKGIVPVGPALAERRAILARQLEGEILGALKLLGEQAATSYLREPLAKSDQRKRQALANRVLRGLKLSAWVKTHLQGLLRNHAARTAGDTQRLLQAEVGIETRIGTRDMQRIEARAGRNLRASDIEPAVRDAIMRAIEEGFAAGDNATKTAQRIRSNVPAGVFTKAGPQYRARLIAQTETSEIQNGAVRAAYAANPHITAVRVRDGVFGPPRSDSTCIARDGDIVPIEDVARVLPLHPLCTLSLDPIVDARQPVTV